MRCCGLVGAGEAHADPGVVAAGAITLVLVGDEKERILAVPADGVGKDFLRIDVGDRFVMIDWIFGKSKTVRRSFGIEVAVEPGTRNLARFYVASDADNFQSWGGEKNQPAAFAFGRQEIDLTIVFECQHGFIRHGESPFSKN